MITQGKWEEIARPYGYDIVSAEKGYPRIIATLYDVDFDLHENAELIASAPETKRQRDELQKQLDEAKADWSGLRDAVMGENNHTCINRSVVESEANLHREKIQARAEIIAAAPETKRQRDELRIACVIAAALKVGSPMNNSTLTLLNEAIANAEREG